MSDSTLSVSPRKYSTPTVISSENGMLAEIKRVIRHSRRKANRISTANRPPVSAVNVRFDRLSWMNCAWLKNTWKPALPTRSVPESFCSSETTALPVSTAFAVDSLRIASTAPALPSTRLMS